MSGSEGVVVVVSFYFRNGVRVRERKAKSFDEYTPSKQEETDTFPPLPAQDSFIPFLSSPLTYIPKSVFGLKEGEDVRY